MFSGPTRKHLMHDRQHVIENKPALPGRRVGVCAVAGLVCRATTTAHAAFGACTLEVLGNHELLCGGAA